MEHVNWDKIAGENLRELRIDVGKSQQSIGQELGISSQQVQKYERGLNRMSAGRVKQLSLFLACDVDDFFGGVRGGINPRTRLSLVRLIKELKNPRMLLPILKALPKRDK